MLIVGFSSISKLVGGDSWKLLSRAKILVPSTTTGGPNFTVAELTVSSPLACYYPCVKNELWLVEVRVDITWITRFTPNRNMNMGDLSTLNACVLFYHWTALGLLWFLLQNWSKHNMHLQAFLHIRKNLSDGTFTILLDGPFCHSYWIPLLLCSHLVWRWRLKSCPVSFQFPLYPSTTGTGT